jgi:hypothetical protein
MSLFEGNVHLRTSSMLLLHLMSVICVLSFPFSAHLPSVSPVSGAAVDRRAEWQAKLGPSRGLFALSRTSAHASDDVAHSVASEPPLTAPQLENLMRAVHTSGALLLHGALSGPDVLRSVTLTLRRYTSRFVFGSSIDRFGRQRVF